MNEIKNNVEPLQFDFTKLSNFNFTDYFQDINNASSSANTTSKTIVVANKSANDLLDIISNIDGALVSYSLNNYSYFSDRNESTLAYRNIVERLRTELRNVTTKEPFSKFIITIFSSTPRKFSSEQKYSENLLKTYISDFSSLSREFSSKNINAANLENKIKEHYKSLMKKQLERLDALIIKESTRLQEHQDTREGLINVLLLYSKEQQKENLWLDFAKLLLPFALVVALLYGTLKLFKQVTEISGDSAYGRLLATELVKNNVIVEVISIVLILSTILTLALSGNLDNNNTALYTLLGTLSGYVLGKRKGNESESNSPPPPPPQGG